MTNKEAIEQLRERLAITDYRQQIPEYYEAIELAVEALEKQMPKKPNYVPDDDTCVYYHWECPECGNYYSYSIRKTFGVLYNNSVSYCSRCGQALNWSDDNDE